MRKPLLSLVVVALVASRLQQQRDHPTGSHRRRCGSPPAVPAAASAVPGSTPLPYPGPTPTPTVASPIQDPGTNP